MLDGDEWHVVDAEEAEEWHVLAHGEVLAAQRALRSAAWPYQGTVTVVARCDAYEVCANLTGVVMFCSTSAQAALQWAMNSGSLCVRVEQGLFELDGPLFLPDGLQLQGAGRATKIIPKCDVAPGTFADGMLRIISKNGVRVCDLSLFVPSDYHDVSAEIGLLFESCGDCVVSGIFAACFSQYAVVLRKNTFLSHVRDSRFAGNGSAGLYLQHLEGDGRVGDYVPNMISGLEIFGGGIGVHLDHALCVNITGCQTFQTGGPGIYATNSSNSLVVSGCRCFQSFSTAMVVENSDELCVSGTALCWQSGNGIELKTVRWGSVSGNNIIDTGSPPDGSFQAASGVVLSGGTKSVHVSSNAIWNWASSPPLLYGVIEDASCSKNLIDSNTINFYKLGDVFSEGAGTIVSGNVSAPESYGVPSSPSERHHFSRDKLDEYISEQTAILFSTLELRQAS
eukprot:TRINITY_DN44676_c0_g1_i1.p1 TRINITY_DN44676_c0_g1~~TRINITY_DN44676_c0_g1_i1.p1  ORF type:complete len:452 (-),score=64.52 TRINITY_DN44676_c0_g1_i1:95-1450(-)